MSAGRFTGENDAVDVDAVGLGLRHGEAQRAESVLDRGGSEGDAGHAVLDVHYVPAHFEPGQEVHRGGFFGAAYPAAAVKVNYGGMRSGVAALIDVELRLIAGRG